MTSKRKPWSAKYKAKVACEALRCVPTVSRLVTKQGMHQTMANDLKRQARNGLAALFYGWHQTRGTSREDG